MSDEIIVEAELTEETAPDIDYCCKCGKVAQWCYMPGGECYCDDCVPRGCSCNVDNVIEFGEPSPDRPVVWFTEDDLQMESPGRTERTPDCIYYEYLDEQGRRSPCCEYMWIGPEEFEEEK